MYDLSLTLRRNYVADFLLCESSDIPVAVVATAYERQQSDETFSLEYGSRNLDWPHFLVVRDSGGRLFEPSPKTVTAVAGGPKATLTLALNSKIGYEGKVPYAPGALVEFAETRRLPAVVTGDTIRVTFPHGGDWDKQSQVYYKVEAGGGIVADGIATIDRSDDGGGNDGGNDGGSSSVSVCEFTVTSSG